MYLQSAVIMDETELPEFIHENMDAPAVNNAITASLPAKVTDHFQLAFTSGRLIRCSVGPCLHLCAKIVSP